MSEPENDLYRPEDLPLDERRRRLAYWVLTGNDFPPRIELLPSWQQHLFKRINLALKIYGGFVEKKC